ncbi:hypothetical protein LJK87_43835 [Paenibacillus sp. P25]|nr:hypothetical protein LJK87_43835 [Paenibacillus sp. P25]
MMPRKGAPRGWSRNEDQIDGAVSSTAALVVSQGYDRGRTGRLGEPVVEGKADTVRTAVEEMSDFLIGRDAGHIEDLWQVLYRGGFYRGGPVLTSAISGIEQALWDIKGKKLGVPVYELLGGPVRDKMRVYAWIGGDKPSEVAKEAREKIASRLLRGQDERDGGDGMDRFAGENPGSGRAARSGP